MQEVVAEMCKAYNEEIRRQLENLMAKEQASHESFQEAMRAKIPKNDGP